MGDDNLDPLQPAPPVGGVRSRRSLVTLRDPGVRAALVLLASAVAGFVLFAVAWRGVARTIYVPFQLPWLMSAGVVGVAIIGAALGALSIQRGAVPMRPTGPLSTTSFARLSSSPTTSGANGSPCGPRGESS